MRNLYTVLFSIESNLEDDRIAFERRRFNMQAAHAKLEAELGEVGHMIIHDAPFAFMMTGELSILNTMELKDLSRKIIKDLLMDPKPWAYGVLANGEHHECDIIDGYDQKWSLILEINVQSDTDVNELILYIHHLSPKERLI